MDRLFTVLLLFSCLATACEPMRSSGRSPERAAESAPAQKESQTRTEERTESDAERRAPVLGEQRRDASQTVPKAPAVADVGVFSDLDSSVQLASATWLEDHTRAAHHPRARHLLAYVDGVAIGLATIDTGELRAVANPGADDTDGDGIPNQLDILLGAKKTALNAAPYKGGYQGLDYPGGDVPRTEGVCTDVIIRAVRNAGIDLQRALHEDIERAGSAYPMVDNPDPNIDQRRVKTLLPFFERQWDAKTTDIDETRDWLPGDVVFMNTMRDERPDHVGIVSDRLGPSGYPLIINNWTSGYHTQPMDLLKMVPVTHRFRLPHSTDPLAEPNTLERALAQHGLYIDSKHRQAVLVRADSDAASATLERYSRDQSGRWSRVARPVDARVGNSGLGVGRGLQAPARTGLRPKVEGDGRAPAGLFKIGMGFGRGEISYDGSWPWRVASPWDRWVDDPESPSYNTWQKKGGDWESAEKLAAYELGLIVMHNSPDPVPDAGSAIFIHDWSLDAGGTLGCTGVARDDMLDLLAWLDIAAKPVLVQLPR